MHPRALLYAFVAALTPLTLCVPAAAAEPTGSLSAADRHAIRQAITTGDDARALERLAKRLPKTDWCAARFSDMPDPGTHAAVRTMNDAPTRARFWGDLAVLARRTRSFRQAGVCFAATLEAAGASGRAAVFYEAEALLQSADDNERRAVRQGILQRVPDPEAQPCAPSYMGPVSWLDCTLAGLAPVHRNPIDEPTMRRTLIEYAARLAPRPAYVRRLDREAAEDSGAFRPPLVKLTPTHAPDRATALRLLTDQMLDDLEDRDPAQDSVSVREVGRSGPWRLYDLRVSNLGIGEFEAQERTALLYAPAADGSLWVFDLGSPGGPFTASTPTLGDWDPERGTVLLSMRRAETDGAREQGAEEDAFCTVTTGAPLCLRMHHAYARYWSLPTPVTTGGVPRWTLKDGRLVARPVPGSYVHPQLAALEGRTLVEAAAMLPALDHALRTALGHPPGTQTPTRAAPVEEKADGARSTHP